MKMFYEVLRESFNTETLKHYETTKVFGTLEDALTYAKRYSRDCGGKRHYTAMTIFECRSECDDCDAFSLHMLMHSRDSKCIYVAGHDGVLHAVEREDPAAEVQVKENQVAETAAATNPELKPATSELQEKVKKLGTGYGMEVYSDTELVAIMTGVSEETARSINMDDPAGCRTVAGISRKKLMVMEAINEYARRKYTRLNTSVDVIHGPEDAYRYVKNRLEREQKEHFCIILLNTKNHVIGFREISVGSLSASIVHPREVMIEAIKGHAASVILVHNHPSGDPGPSREDLKVTEQLVKAGRILDIPVLDHVIVGRERFLSLKGKGLM